MPTEVIMPQMGESIFEGTITKWLKKPGDKVERDEPLFEISTDKVDAEIPAPAAGVLKEIKVPEGQTVPIQTVVAVIDADGAAAAAPAPAPAKAGAAKSEPAKAAPEKKTEAGPPQTAVSSEEPPGAAAVKTGKSPVAPAPQAQAQTAPAARTPAPPRGDGQRVHSSPLVRRLAREHHIDLSALQGTGAG